MKIFKTLFFNVRNKFLTEFCYGKLSVCPTLSECFLKWSHYFVFICFNFYGTKYNVNRTMCSSEKLKGRMCALYEHTGLCHAINFRQQPIWKMEKKYNIVIISSDQPYPHSFLKFVRTHKVMPPLYMACFAFRQLIFLPLAQPKLD